MLSRVVREATGMDIANTSLQLVALEERPRSRRSEKALGRSDSRKRGKMAGPAHQVDQRRRPMTPLALKGNGGCFQIGSAG
jgi:hypothetical protein